MWFLSSLCLFGWFVLGVCEEAVPKGEKVVNGQATVTSNWPWMGVLLSSYPNSNSISKFCGGSLIRATNPAAVLTAAHCLSNFDAQNLLLQVGFGMDRFSEVFSSSVTKYDATRYVLHPSYDRNNHDNDIAIIFLSKAVTGITPVSYATSIFSAPFGSSLTVVGYGWSQWNGPDTLTLEQGSLKYVPDDMCNVRMVQYQLKKYYGLSGPRLASYNSTATIPFKVLNDQNAVICAASNQRVTACKGDSGGPLIHGTNRYGTLVGVVSWGYECIPGLTSVYADVGNANSFIKQTLSQYSTAATPAPTPTWSNYNWARSASLRSLRPLSSAVLLILCAILSHQL